MLAQTELILNKNGLILMIAFSPFCSGGEQRLEITAACPSSQPQKPTSLRASGRIKLLPEMIS